MSDSDLAARQRVDPKRETRMMVAIGLMSGTSMDGIDVALIRTNGEKRVERGPSRSYPYESAIRREIREALDVAKQIVKRGDRPGNLREVEAHITALHAVAVEKFIAEHGLRLSDIDLLGFHGQTVLHRPNRGLSVQLGDGQKLADLTGLPVVYGLRQNDLRHGGEGAPLAPAYHRALCHGLPESHTGLWPIAFVNIGGIANITWIGGDGAMLAFDTGPGNALIDQWVSVHAGIPYDQNGLIAAEGFVDSGLAETYLSSAYFAAPPPKSLDRNDFLPPEPGLASLEDGARTLAHVTARSVLKALEHVPEPPKLWILTGGGAHNPIILQEFAEALADTAIPAARAATIAIAEEVGFDSDSMEAEAWAFLAVRAFQRRKISWPGTTGVRKAVTGGEMAAPKQPRAEANKGETSW
jgi:anhydro-N-acetylmuramic acid kinase